MSKNVYFLSIDAKRDFFDFLKFSHFFKKSHKTNNLPKGNLYLLAYCSKGSLVITISKKYISLSPGHFFKSSSETKTVVHFDKEDFWDTLYVFYRKMTNDASLEKSVNKPLYEYR